MGRKGSRQAWTKLAQDIEGSGPRPTPPVEKHQPKTYKALEFQIQCSFIDWVRVMEINQIPDLALLHAIPNGGHRHPAVGNKMKREGVKRGIPDLCLPVPRGPYHGLYMETKAEDGELSKDQVGVISELRLQGYRVEVCYSVEELISTTVDYLGLNGHG